ncbi:MAG: 2-C-methyl-D-erythritol 2,4-cyclodiphosphate synthase [Bacteroidia bacterium]|nr:2-C-methyl-D-erythritol 2,4-cyclodiphosphate synthase [Bacteroidia bacterium]
MNIRIGFGFDVHQLSQGYPLFLGGVKLDAEKGAVGHSDADVLIHAICDAILGAAAMRDIGFHFPNTDPKYKGIDSKLLLKEVVAKISSVGYKISNIDSTVCLEQPKVNPHIPAMVKVLAAICEIAEDAVSIKATTNEKLGYIGREEGLAAYASVLLYK